MGKSASRAEKKYDSSRGRRSGTALARGGVGGEQEHHREVGGGGDVHRVGERLGAVVDAAGEDGCSRRGHTAGEAAHGAMLPPPGRTGGSAAGSHVEPHRLQRLHEPRERLRPGGHSVRLPRASAASSAPAAWRSSPRAPSVSPVSRRRPGHQRGHRVLVEGLPRRVRRVAHRLARGAIHEGPARALPTSSWRRELQEVQRPDAHRRPEGLARSPVAQPHRLAAARVTVAARHHARGARWATRPRSHHPQRDPHRVAAFQHRRGGTTASTARPSSSSGRSSATIRATAERSPWRLPTRSPTEDGARPPTRTTAVPFARRSGRYTSARVTTPSHPRSARSEAPSATPSPHEHATRERVAFAHPSPPPARGPRRRAAPARQRRGRRRRG